MLSERVFMDGLVYTGGFVFIIIVSVLVNPRIWLQDLPEHVKKDIPPKNRRESHQTFITGFLFALFIVGFPLYSVSDLLSRAVSHVPFWDRFFRSFSVMMICNILYWLFFDILIFNVMISHIRKIPGVQSRLKFSGWRRQFFGMIVGVLSCFLISGFVATAAGFFQ